MITAEQAQTEVKNWYPGAKVREFKLGHPDRPVRSFMIVSELSGQLSNGEISENAAWIAAYNRLHPKSF